MHFMTCLSGSAFHAVTSRLSEGPLRLPGYDLLDPALRNVRSCFQALLVRDCPDRLRTRKGKVPFGYLDIGSGARHAPGCLCLG